MKPNGGLLQCKVCGKEFYVPKCFLKTRVYCSKKCLKYKTFSLEQRENMRIAHIGQKGNMTGKKWPVEVKKRMSIAALNRFQDETNHPRWTGDKVSYGGLHDWVNARLGHPDTCEYCGKYGLKGRRIHWANKSHEYKRNLNDWLRLCVPCHRKYDKVENLITITC